VVVGAEVHFISASFEVIQEGQGQTIGLTGKRVLSLRK